jgi:hypothetical protein
MAADMPLSVIRRFGPPISFLWPVSLLLLQIGDPTTQPAVLAYKPSPRLAHFVDQRVRGSAIATGPFHSSFQRLSGVIIARSPEGSIHYL